MRIKSAIFKILLLAVLPLSGQAAVVEHMFETEFPVVNQERDVRAAAFEQGFIEVLVRVSGNSQVPTQLDISKAARYVSQYRYLPLKQVAQPVSIPDEQVMPPAKYRLWIQFNEGAIKQLLRDSNLPIWGQQRPSVLLWLAVRDGRNRYILRDQDASAIKEAVSSETQRRGLPVIWPKVDQADQQYVSFADVWGSFWQPILRASERYGVDAVVVGRMNWQDGGWQVDWSMNLDKTSTSWKLRALDLKLLMASGIDVATDQISRRFAVLDGVDNTGQLIVQVNGINHIKTYARINQYLSSLAPVKNVYVSHINDSAVKFHVALSGDKNDLKRIIALGQTLVPDQTVTVTPPVTQPVPLNGVQPVPQQPAENLLTYKLNQ